MPKGDRRPGQFNLIAQEYNYQIQRNPKAWENPKVSKAMAKNADRSLEIARNRLLKEAGSRQPAQPKFAPTNHWAMRFRSGK